MRRVAAYRTSSTGWLFTIALVLVGCSEDTGGGPSTAGSGGGATGSGGAGGTAGAGACAAGEALDSGGGCCAAGETVLDAGGCRPAGIAPNECAAGFLADDRAGCEPVLPGEPCPKGLMAVPGDTTCREVAPCGMGSWGDIPTEASTQHVDGSYAVGDSDGTAAKPWTTIQAAVDAAAPGAIVAVAAGSYIEDVTVDAKPVRLWGRCPAQVEIVGTQASFPAVLVK